MSFPLDERGLAIPTPEQAMKMAAGAPPFGAGRRTA